LTAAANKPAQGEPASRQSDETAIPLSNARPQ
jgi:hypothetical protein